MTNKYKKNIYRLKVGGSKTRITDYTFSVRHTEDFYIKVKPSDINQREDKSYEKKLVKAGEWGKVTKSQEYFFDDINENGYSNIDKQEWTSKFEFKKHLGFRHLWKKVGPTSVLSFSLLVFIILCYEIWTSISILSEHWTNWLFMSIEIILLIVSLIHLIISTKELIEIKCSQLEFIKFIEKHPTAAIHEKVRAGKMNHIEKDDEYKTYIRFFVKRNTIGLLRVYSETFTKQSNEIHNITLNRGFNHNKLLNTIDYGYVTQFNDGYKNIGHERVTGLSRIRLDKLNGEYITTDNSNNEGLIEFIKE